MRRVTVQEDQLITCPYEKTHQIRIQRMQVHLVKCRKNHLSKHQEMDQCPFNVTHVVPKQEFDVHVKICPERGNFEHYRFKEDMVNAPLANSDQSFSESIKSFDIPKAVPAEGLSNHWDLDPDVPSYDPSVYAANAPILRMPHGMTPSERRRFREKEHERLTGNDNN